MFQQEELDKLKSEFQSLWQSSTDSERSFFYIEMEKLKDLLDRKSYLKKRIQSRKAYKSFVDGFERSARNENIIIASLVLLYIVVSFFIDNYRMLLVLSSVFLSIFIKLIIDQQRHLDTKKLIATVNLQDEDEIIFIEHQLDGKVPDSYVILNSHLLDDERYLENQHYHYNHMISVILLTHDRMKNGTVE